MTFLLPWAWLGLLAAPVLVALYLWRRRHRPQPVGALFLWRAPRVQTGGGRRLARLEQALLLLLELLAVALLTLAATAPGCRSARRVHRLAVVLDDSASLAARPGPEARSAADRATAWLTTELAARRPFSCALVQSGVPPRLVSTALANRADLVAALREWQPRQAAHDLGPALRLARQTVGPDAPVVLLTDRPPPPEPGDPPGVHRLAFGEPLGNLGIVAASRECDPVAGRECVAVEVVAAGPLPSGRVLECRHGDRLLARRELAIPDGPGLRSCRETFAWDRPLVGAVALRLAGTDALAADDTALLLPERRVPVRVQTSCGADRPELARLFARTLAALGPAATPVAERPHLVLADHADGWAADLAAGAWLLVADPGTGPARRHFGPYVLARRHPLCAGLELAGVRWAAPADGLGAGDWVPLVGSAGVPLLGELPGPGPGRVFRMSFRPEGSNLQRTPAWPVLVHNLVQARAETLPGFRLRNLRAGQQAVYQAAPDAPAEQAVSVRQVLPAAAAAPLLTGRFRGRTWSFVPPWPGLYAATFSGAPQTPELVACQLACPEESDLRGAATGEWGRPAALARLADGTWQDDAWRFLLAALAVGLVHLWLATRRNGLEVPR